MINHGIAKASVQITDVLPEINRYPRMPFFDIVASKISQEATKNSNFQPSILLQNIGSSDESFNVAIPSIRKIEVDVATTNSTTTDLPPIGELSSNDWEIISKFVLASTRDNPETEIP